MATYVVGDIQACYQGLQTLLDKIAFSPSRDTLWAVGDLIGRGPQALETLDYLEGLGNAFDTVLGNHDLHFLAVSQGIRPVKTKDGFRAILDSPRSQRLVEWLRAKPLAAIPQKGYFLSHAGLYPLWSESEALQHAEEASAALLSEDWCATMQFMYGSEAWCWSDSLQGVERIKFIIDAFTRMRFVDANGTLDFDAKTRVADAPAGYQAWFNHAGLNHQSTLLFGHWAALEGHTGRPQIQALDTGYIWGGQLTAIHLESSERISVKNPFLS